MTIVVLYTLPFYVDAQSEQSVFNSVSHMLTDVILDLCMSLCIIVINAHSFLEMMFVDTTGSTTEMQGVARMQGGLR